MEPNKVFKKPGTSTSTKIETMGVLIDFQSKTRMAAKINNTAIIFSRFSSQTQDDSPEMASQNNYRQEAVPTCFNINKYKVSCLKQQRVEFNMLLGSQPSSEAILVQHWYSYHPTIGMSMYASSKATLG